MGTEDNLKLLMKSCPELFINRNVVIFQHFLCPISIVDADVKEYVIDEYDSVELLVLRLYDAGLRNSAEITSLTGIDQNMVKKLLFTEEYTYGHINPNTGELTNAGISTLRDNTDINNLFQHALYNVKRELQVDALTGTLVSAEAEVLKSKMVNYSDSIILNVLPKEAVKIDVELNREIHERLQFYIDKGYFSEGNTINAICKMYTKEIKYRDAYYTVIEGFKYPFIAIVYEKRIDGKYEKVVAPIAISQDDFNRIKPSIAKLKYLVRADRNFDYLNNYRNEFESRAEINEDMLRKILSDQNDEGDVKIDITDDIIEDMKEE